MFITEKEADHEIRLDEIEEDDIREEIVEMSSDMVDEDLPLNLLIAEEKKASRKEDRAITMPTEHITMKGSKKSAISLKDTKTIPISETLPIDRNSSKHHTSGTSKSYSLSKSVINEREIIDIQGPITGEMFVSMKDTPILDDYQIGKILGEGSYGQVKLVRHIRTNEERAVKIIKKAGVSKSEKDTMMKEVSILMSLDHPNIIKIFDLYEDDNKIYIVTE